MSAKLTPATRARFQNPTSPTTRALHRVSVPTITRPATPWNRHAFHTPYSPLYTQSGWPGEKTNGRKETRAGVGTKRSNALCSSFMLLAPTLAPSVLHSEKQRGKKRKEKEKKKEGKKKGRKKGRKRRKREEFATPELEINHPVIRVFSAFSALSLFAINAHAEMHPGTARISRDCFSSFNRREKFAVSTRDWVRDKFSFCRWTNRRERFRCWTRERDEAGGGVKEYSNNIKYSLSHKLPLLLNWTKFRKFRYRWSYNKCDYRCLASFIPLKRRGVKRAPDPTSSFNPLPSSLSNLRTLFWNLSKNNIARSDVSYR